jgi:uncharacterized protein YsxB (DUF464 family)
MIEIKFNLSNNRIEFSSVGHADFADYGKDVVCAAVSSIIIGALNALKSEELDIKIKKGDVKVSGNLNSHDEIVFETMLVQLKTIEDQYPNNLKINEGSN